MPTKAKELTRRVKAHGGKGVSRTKARRTVGFSRGRNTPLALMGFEEEDDRFDSQNRRFPGRLLKIRVFGTSGLGRGRVPDFLWVFVVFGRFPWVSGRVSYPLGLILESAFLWPCFC